MKGKPRRILDFVFFGGGGVLCWPGPSAEMCRGFLLYKFWRILPGIFLGDFSGHFFPQIWGEKIRRQNPRKNPAAQKIESAKNPFCQEPAQIFVEFWLTSCLCLVCYLFVFLSPSVLLVAKAQPPKRQRIWKTRRFKWFLVVLFCFAGVSSLWQPRKKPPPQSKKQQKNKNKKGKGLSCCRDPKTRIKPKENDNTNPQQTLGKGYVAVWPSP